MFLREGGGFVGGRTEKDSPVNTFKQLFHVEQTNNGARTMGLPHIMVWILSYQWGKSAKFAMEVPNAVGGKDPHLPKDDNFNRIKRCQPRPRIYIIH